MTQIDFRNQVDNLMNILFGAGVASHATIIEQINYLVFLRSLSRKDDNAMILDPSAEKIFSGELRKYHWDNLLILNADELFNSLEEVFRKLPEITTNQTIKLLFRDAHVKVFDKPTLRRLVHEIEKMFSDLEKQATAGHTDIFGDMYEYLLSKLSQAGTLGSFRTPRHIIKFIVDVIDPKKSETILDPACGTAGFLVAALKHLEEEYSSDEFKKLDKYPMDLLTPQERDFVYKYTFTGFDSDFDMFKFGLMNLYLHKLEHPNMKRQNTLVDTAGDRTKWDVILANPPFAGALDIDSISEDLRMGTRSTEILFLRYIIDHLSSSGRAGVIVPEGVVFNSTNAHKKIRQMLVEDAGLWCVVSLPGGIFNPYAGVKTSILFFDKSLKDKVKDILFVKIENDGFDLGSTKRPINKNDLPLAFETINQWRKDKKIEGKNVKIVNQKEIIDHNYNLNGDQYGSEINEINTKWPIVKIAEICEISRGGSPRPIDDFITNAENGINWIKIGDVKEGEKYIYSTKEKIKPEGLNKTRTVKEGDFILSNSMSFGRPYIMKISGAIHDGWLLLRLKNNHILADYLYHILSSEKTKEQFKQFATGGVVSNLNSEIVRNVKIPLPPLEIQQQIAEEIDGYQKIIDGVKQVVENWKPKIKFNSNFEIVKLTDLVEINKKTINPKVTYKDNDFRYIDISSIENGTGRIVSKKEMTGKEAPSRARRVFSKNDILMSTVRPNLKGFAIVDYEVKDEIASTGFAVLSPKNKTNSNFIFYQLFDEFVQNQFISRMGKGSYPSVNEKDLEEIKIYSTPLENQEKIVGQIEKEKSIIDPLKKLIELYQEKINQKIEEVWSD